MNPETVQTRPVDDPAADMARCLAVFQRLAGSKNPADVMQRIKLANQIAELGPKLQDQANGDRAKMLTVLAA